MNEMLLVVQLTVVLVLVNYLAFVGKYVVQSEFFFLQGVSKLRPSRVGTSAHRQKCYN